MSAARDSGVSEGWQDQEDQPQDVVLDVVDLVVEVGHPCLLPAPGVLELGHLAAQRVGAPEVVDTAALGRRHQPGRRVVGDPRHRPLLQRGEQRVLREVLGQVDVTRHPGESTKNEAGRLGPPRGDHDP